MNVMDAFFEKINHLPMLPKVVQEVTEIIDQDDLDMRVLADTINHDQVLAAKILRMSNSAYFGCSRTIKTVDDALSIIGVAKLKTLVVASGVTSTFEEVPDFDLQRFWLHSLVTACVARQLAHELKSDPDIAYISGLMHSVGQLPLQMVFPAAGAQVDHACKGRGILERKTVEQSIFGLDHCQVGEKLAVLWQFPEEIQHAIRYYADPLNENACHLAPVVYTAAHSGLDLELGKESIYTAETLDPDVATAIGMDTVALSEFIESCRGFVHEAKTYI